MMRESRQYSTISNSEKLKYPRCDKRKEHAKQTLNLVCLTQNCKNRGLICLQCKSSGDHLKCHIQPLRTFLTKLEESLKRIELDPNASIPEHSSPFKASQRSVVDRLEEQHLQMLSLLKIQIEEIAERVRCCEEELLKEYNRTREKLVLEFQKETLISKTLAEIQDFFIEPEREAHLDLRFSVIKLLSLLKVQKNDISILNESEAQLNTYCLAAKTFKTNILVWQRETANIIAQIFKLKPEYQLKQHINRPTTAVDSASKAVSLTFSTQFKTDSISLQKQNKIAKVKDQKNGKIILLNQSVLDYKSTSVKFKVISLFGASVMQIGLCLKPTVTQKLYKFQKNNANHGLFVAASNGFSFSTGDPIANNVKNTMLFKTGDQISLQVDSKQNKLIIKKKSDSKTIQINLKHVAEAEWKELYFCVGMSSLGDKVQLIN